MRQQSTALDDRFTIRIDPDGRPFRRVLREMSGNEVWRALQWHAAEMARLEALIDPPLDLEAQWAAVTAGELDADDAAAQCQHAAALTQAATIAINRGCRLLETVVATLPRGVPGDMRFIDVLDRYWSPG